MHSTKWYHLRTEDGQPSPSLVIMGFVFPLTSLIFLFLFFFPNFRDEIHPRKIVEGIVFGFSAGAAIMLWKLSNPYARWWMVYSHLWVAEGEELESRKPIRKNFRILAWLMCFIAITLPYSLRFFWK